jgi:hypothetical protein
MKSTKYHSVQVIPKSNNKIVGRDKIDTSNTQIHDLSLSWVGDLIFGVLTPLSAVFQLYHGDQF